MTVCSNCGWGKTGISTYSPFRHGTKLSFHHAFTSKSTFLDTVVPSQDGISKPEISTSDFWIFDELLGGPAASDMSAFHDVTSVGNRQSQIDVLFDQQNCHALAADRHQRIDQLLHNYGCQSQAHLVDHQEDRSGHQSAGHRAHLLF